MCDHSLATCGFLILMAMLFLFMAPGSLDARQNTGDTSVVKYLAAQDRIKLGNSDAAIPLLRLQLKQTPNHTPSLKDYFRLWSSNKTDQEIARELNRWLSVKDKPRLVDSLIDLTPMSETGEYLFWRSKQKEVTLPPEIFADLLRGASLSAHSGFIMRKINLLERTYRNDFEPHLFYGDWFWIRNLTESARHQYQRLLRIRPGDPTGYEALMHYYRMRDNQKQERIMRERLRALRDE